MTPTAYVFGVLAALLTLAVVVEMLRRRRLRERHAVWWLLAGTLALLIGLFPTLLEWAADVVGIDVPTNLVFFVSIAVLFLVCIQHSSELTLLESQTRTLAETSTLQALRLEELEHRLASVPPPQRSGVIEPSVPELGGGAAHHDKGRYVDEDSGQRSD